MLSLFIVIFINRCLCYLLSLLIVIFILCKILNKINNPIFKEINKFNPLRSPPVFTYIEEQTNFNNEKKIQLLSKNNDTQIFFQQ